MSGLTGENGMSALVDRLVAQVLGLHVRLLACQARLSASTDPEALHDLRTTVRRLRSLLRPLRGLPGVEQLEAAAAGVGTLTTPMRDREVLAAYLLSHGQTAAAEQRMRQMAQAYPAVAGSPQLAQLLMVLDAFLGSCAPPSARGCSSACEHASRSVWPSSGIAWTRPCTIRPMTVIACAC